jgi:RNA polymerase sigma-70 factor (ECF subfamily)
MNRPEFEALALEQLDAVYRMCLQLTRNPEEAQDLVQEVYLRALRPRAVEGFEDRSASPGGAGGAGGAGGGMRAWLFTIAHHTFYSRLKRARRAPASMGEFFDERSEERLPDEPPPAWDLASLDWEHVDERLKRAIEGLKTEYREVLLLWGVEGMKYREIAAILDVPIGTIMSRLHRARKVLADELGGPDGPAAELGMRGLAGGSRDEPEPGSGEVQ